MNDLIRLALTLAQQAAARRGRQVAVRAAVVLAGALAAMACGVAALACALVSLWIYVLPHVGAAGAPLVVAGVLLFLCVVALLVMRAVLKRPLKRSSPAVPAALLHAEASRAVREHKGTAVTAALVAGMAAGMHQK